MKSICQILLLITLFAINSSAQVSITTDNSAPHASSMLDIKSNAKGILVPRMSTSARNAIGSPAKGLMVYDSTINSFFFFNGTAWLNVSGGNSVVNQIADADNDTKVQVEASADEDKIRFKTNNFEQLVLDGKSARLQSPGNSLFIGMDAGLNDDGTTNNNLFIGLNAGKDNVTGTGNTFIGFQSGRKNTTHNNTFIGSSSGFNTTSGSGNTFVGETTGFNNSTGFSNTFIGATTGQGNTTGNHNTFLGHTAGGVNSTGSGNTFLGNDAGSDNSTASNNTFVGLSAGANNTIGFDNTFIGHEAGFSNTTADENVSIGKNAGRLSTTGDFNVIIGSNAAVACTTCISNVIIGHRAGNASLNMGANTFIGPLAAETFQSGLFNTFIGTQANVGTTSSEQATTIGYGASTANGVANSTALGALSIASTSQKVRLGNGSIMTIEGQVAYSFPSDGRFKINVQENVPGLRFIEKLRPVTYQFDLPTYDQFIRPELNANFALSDTLYQRQLQQGVATIHTGFIAQEVEAAANEIGFDFDGVVKPQNEKDNYGLRYAEFVVPLVKAVQELNAENQALREHIENLSARLEAVEALRSTTIGN